MGIRTELIPAQPQTLFGSQRFQSSKKSTHISEEQKWLQRKRQQSTVRASRVYSPIQSPYFACRSGVEIVPVYRPHPTEGQNGCLGGGKRKGEVPLCRDEGLHPTGRLNCPWEFRGMNPWLGHKGVPFRWKGNLIARPLNSPNRRIRDPYVWWVWKGGTGRLFLSRLEGTTPSLR